MSNRVTNTLKLSVVLFQRNGWGRLKGGDIRSQELNPFRFLQKKVSFYTFFKKIVIEIMISYIHVSLKTQQ